MSYTATLDVEVTVSGGNGMLKTFQPFTPIVLPTSPGMELLISLTSGQQIAIQISGGNFAVGSSQFTDIPTFIILQPDPALVSDGLVLKNNAGDSDFLDFTAASPAIIPFGGANGFFIIKNTNAATMALMIYAI